jgi:hypothetical protein
VSTLGAKQDRGKRRWDLLPWRAVGVVVDVLTFGAQKYSEFNWVHVPKARERYFAALQRHLTDWWNGEANDPETGFSHLAHAICCALFLLALEIGDVGPGKSPGTELEVYELVSVDPLPEGAALREGVLPRGQR